MARPQRVSARRIRADPWIMGRRAEPRVRDSAASGQNPPLAERWCVWTGPTPHYTSPAAAIPWLAAAVPGP
jgi:hypothetical protein